MRVRVVRGIEITRPNQVWAMDITYIPMARGFVYLAVVLDWFSRRVLSWRISITMEPAFCVETLEDALARHGKPEIFNTDQGSQFRHGYRRGKAVQTTGSNPIRQPKGWTSWTYLGRPRAANRQSMSEDQGPDQVIRESYITLIILVRLLRREGARPSARCYLASG